MMQEMSMIQRLCVVLPNGRRFQLQVLIRRKGQPVWSFSGVPGAQFSAGSVCLRVVTVHTRLFSC